MKSQYPTTIYFSHAIRAAGFYDLGNYPDRDCGGGGWKGLGPPLARAT